MMITRDPSLAAHPIFEGLSDELLDAALCGAHAWKAKAGTTVMSPHLPSPALVLCLQGRLISTDISPVGREMIYELIGPGGCDGVLSVFGRRPHYTICAVDSQVAVLSRRRIETLVEGDHRFALKLGAETATKLEAREQRLAVWSLQRARDRVALHLVGLAERHAACDGAQVDLDWEVTHQQLADMLGVRRETATVALGELRRQGLIGRRNGRRIVVDVESLRRLVSAVAAQDGVRPVASVAPRPRSA